MDNIEQQITASTAAPSRRLLSPEIEWLRENRTQIREKYAGKWIAVLGASLLGNSDSLKDLHAEMKARNINNASFVHVSEPLAPQS